MVKKKDPSVLPDSPKKYQPFRYPGGKSKLSVNPAFQALLFPLAASGDTFYEGFVGSGAITLAVAIHDKQKKLVVCDKDVTISCFWKLISAGSDLEISQLEDLIMMFDAMPAVRENKKAFLPEKDERRQETKFKNHPPFEEPNLRKVEYFKMLRDRGELGRAKENPVILSMIEWAFHAIIFNRTTFSGIAMSQPIGGYNQSSEWTIDCRFNAKLLVEKIRNLRKLLYGRMTVYNMDILVWLRDIVPPNAPMYLDPPYYVKGEALYPVSMENFEHGDMADTLGAKQNWIMSYDICPEITKLYEFQNTLEIPFRYSINGKKDNWNHQQEYLICSPEIDTRGFEIELVKWKAEVKHRAELKAVPEEEDDEQ